MIPILVLLTLVASPAMAADYIYQEPPVVVAPRPPVVIEEPHVSIVPRCHVVRETKHDDILGTDDWTEREVCD